MQKLSRFSTTLASLGTLLSSALNFFFLKRWYLPTSLHGVTTQKNNIVILTIVRISKFICVLISKKLSAWTYYMEPNSCSRFLCVWPVLWGSIDKHQYCLKVWSASRSCRFTSHNETPVLIALHKLCKLCSCIIFCVISTPYVPGNVSWNYLRNSWQP
jgi:hypothetical protein